jgi:putative salt-induced outer membrane protein YdiY
MAGTALAQDTSVKTNEVNSAEAKAAMSVIKSDEKTEAAEVAKTVRIAAESANNEAVAKESKFGYLKKFIKYREPEAKEAKKEPALWDAFMPPPDSEFDWIQLTSGEWLKGDFKVMYDYEVEFDSDEMDLQTFDVDDVKRMRTRGMQTIFIQGEGGRRDTEVLRGILEVRENEVVLRRAEHEVVVPRSRVISIAGGKQKERDNWSGMISLGINARGGNTETTDTTAMANVKRRTAASRLGVDYLANYSQSGDLETANNQRLNAYYDRFLTGRFFWQVLAGEYYRDPFSNVDNQYSLSTGAGYDITHTSKTEWSLGLGLGYQNQKFVSVEVGKDQESSSPFVTAGTVFDLEVTGNLDFLFDYSLRILNEENGTYTHHMLTQLSFDLISDFDLDVSLIWDRTETPQPAADGSVPKQDDYQLIVSLAYDF